MPLWIMTTTLLVLAAASRREGTVLGDDQRDHGAAFGRGSDVQHFDEARGALQPVRNIDGFGVGRGFVPIALLAGGEQVARRILGAGRQRCGRLGGGRLDGGMRCDGVLREGERGEG